MWLQDLNYRTLWLRIGFPIPPKFSRSFSVRTNSVPRSPLFSLREGTWSTEYVEQGHSMLSINSVAGRVAFWRGQRNSLHVQRRLLN